ncbi:MAG TPA: orotidine-5'-phosphate decarboxylase [Gemmatimonadaceae bacterium]|jgi:orotidine-5'-phosphate decarboxylase|nr:orotidine-5'-phosphate decarboxylase [Gemmatimonadaceae bacterium]
MTPHSRPAGTRTKIATKSAAPARGSRPIPIVALDFPRADVALAMVDRLGDTCRFYKVGGELFTAAGPQVVQALRALGNDVFLDLKLHDIPKTVEGAARSAAEIGAKLLTVHATGGREMLAAAVEGAGDRCGVLGVTILTSLDAAMLRSAWGRKTLEVYGEVLRLAGECASVGAHGVVCSGLEASKIGAKYGDKLKLLVPGIRAAGAQTDDQKRAVTAAEAAQAGANYIVLGRMITQAKDPKSELMAVMRSI